MVQTQVERPKEHGLSVQHASSVAAGSGGMAAYDLCEFEGAPVGPALPEIQSADAFAADLELSRRRPLDVQLTNRIEV